MAKFALQAVTLLLNQEGTVAQVVYRGQVSLRKSQTVMEFIWQPSDEQQAALQQLLDAGLTVVKEGEGLD